MSVDQESVVITCNESKNCNGGTGTIKQLSGVYPSLFVIAEVVLWHILFGQTPAI